jgi:hypothetical protein
LDLAVYGHVVGGYYDHCWKIAGAVLAVGVGRRGIDNDDILEGTRAVINGTD